LIQIAHHRLLPEIGGRVSDFYQNDAPSTSVVAGIDDPGPAFGEALTGITDPGYNSLKKFETIFGFSGSTSWNVDV
jgi:hypothetical protein